MEKELYCVRYYDEAQQKILSFAPVSYKRALIVVKVLAMQEYSSNIEILDKNGDVFEGI